MKKTNSKNCVFSLQLEVIKPKKYSKYIRYILIINQDNQRVLLMYYNGLHTKSKKIRQGLNSNIF